METPELRQLRALTERQQAAITDLRHQVADARAALQRERTSREGLERMLSEEAAKVGRLESEKAELAKVNRDLSDRLRVAEADVKVARAERDADRAARERAQRDLAATVARTRNAEREATAARDALAAATARVEKIDARILELEAILADPRDTSTAAIHAFLTEYWRSIASRRIEDVMLAWSTPDEPQLRALVERVEWVTVKRVAARIPEKNAAGDLTSTAYVCITSKNRDAPEDDWAGTVHLRTRDAGWRIERVSMSKGPCS